MKTLYIDWDKLDIEAFKKDFNEFLKVCPEHVRNTVLAWYENQIVRHAVNKLLMKHSHGQTD